VSVTAMFQRTTQLVHSCHMMAFWSSRSRQFKTCRSYSSC